MDAFPLTPQAVFLGLLLAGSGCLLAGLGLIRLCWRRDLPSCGWDLDLVDMLLHPDHYVEGLLASLVSGLNLTGLLLLGAALAVAVRGISKIAQ